MQIATKVGALDVPEWYDAGKVSIENSSIPFGAQLATHLVCVGSTLYA